MMGDCKPAENLPCVFSVHFPLSQQQKRAVPACRLKRRLLLLITPHSLHCMHFTHIYHFNSKVVKNGILKCCLGVHIWGHATSITITTTNIITVNIDNTTFIAVIISAYCHHITSSAIVTIITTATVVTTTTAVITISICQH